MKLSAPLSRRAVPVWLDWRVAAPSDMIILLGIGIIFAFAHVHGPPPHLRQFGSGFVDREVEDATFVVFMPSIALMVYGFWRYRDLYLFSKAVPADDVTAPIQRPTNYSDLV
jgi:hypothetical protein